MYDVTIVTRYLFFLVLFLSGVKSFRAYFSLFSQRSVYYAHVVDDHFAFNFYEQSVCSLFESSGQWSLACCLYYEIDDAGDAEFDGASLAAWFLYVADDCLRTFVR